ncbi:MAG: dienelactone hydrolase family protein [Acidobacteria bacterium]|nr:dienelactone hydrolase family protein [Acidobacteriota bacterium]
MLSAMWLALWLTTLGFAQSTSPAVARAAGEAATTVPVLPPGVHNQTLSRDGGEAIRYAISIPPGYSPAARVPLVLALHFGGNPVGAGRAVLDLLIRPALADLGAIVVAPDSIDGGWSGRQNEHAVHTLLDAVLKTYSVDPRKVIVTGFSMGGAGTWHWANKFPERFSAAIPVAGRPTGSASAWRVPVFAVHSQDDERVPIGPAQRQIEELKQLGKNAEIVVLTGITHYETSRYVEGLRRAVPWVKDLWK